MKRKTKPWHAPDPARCPACSELYTRTPAGIREATAKGGELVCLRCQPSKEPRWRDPADMARERAARLLHDRAEDLYRLAAKHGGSLAVSRAERAGLTDWRELVDHIAKHGGRIKVVGLGTATTIETGGSGR